MKKAILGLVLWQLLVVPSVFAAAPLATPVTKVPEMVLKTFQTMFPDVLEDIEWEEVDEDFTAAFLNEDGYYQRATFTSVGTWKITMTELEESDLPEGILTYVDEQYDNVDMYNEMQLIEMPDSVFYHISLILDDETLVDLRFDTDGNLME